VVTGIFRDARDADMSQLATRADLAPLATKADLAQLEATAKSENAAIRSEVEILRRDLTIRLGSMIVVATGILLAAKLFGRS
jgi:hypothetical protein